MFHQERLTDPFTGERFVATFDSDNTMTATNPLTGQSYTFNIKGNTICIPLEYFEYIETVTFTDAAKMLDISRQRINKIAKDGIIPMYRLNGRRVFKLSDVIRYKRTRKVGKPAKEEL